MSDSEMETISPPQSGGPPQAVHEITSTYDYEACCNCCCCVDTEQSVLGQGVIFVTRWFGCCACRGREEHIVKTEHMEKVVLAVPNGGECIFVSPVKVKVESRNGSHTNIRLHRTDAKDFRADVSKLMSDKVLNSVELKVKD